MTKKEKKLEALRLKAEIEAKKPPKEWQPPTKEETDKQNWKRYRPRRREFDDEKWERRNRKLKGY